MHLDHNKSNCFLDGVFNPFGFGGERSSRSGEPRVPSPPNWFSAKLLFGGEYVLNP